MEPRSFSMNAHRQRKGARYISTLLLSVSMRYSVQQISVYRSIQFKKSTILAIIVSFVSKFVALLSSKTLITILHPFTFGVDTALFSKFCSTNWKIIDLIRLLLLRPLHEYEPLFHHHALSDTVAFQHIV